MHSPTLPPEPRASIIEGLCFVAIVLGMLVVGAVCSLEPRGAHEIRVQHCVHSVSTLEEHDCYEVQQ